jgi:hypothetical protein
METEDEKEAISARTYTHCHSLLFLASQIAIREVVVIPWRQGRTLSDK